LASTSSFHENPTLSQFTDTHSMTQTSKDPDFMLSNNDDLENKISENIDGNESCANGYSEDSGDESIKLMEDQKKWTVQHKPTSSSLNELLLLLNKYGFKLPKDGRALLKTDYVIIEPMGQDL
jgi:hypothetical protein